MADTATLFRIEDRSDGEFRVISTADEVRRCLDEGVMAAVLRDRGYDGQSLRKLAHENWVRVLRKTWGD